MKKTIKIFLIFTLAFFLSIETVSAKTLGDLKKELKEMEKKYANSESEKTLTESEIKKVNNNIGTITTKITESEKTIKKLNDEIVELNELSIEKEKQIKEIVAFLQISGGENVYLEYVFGATDITDFIYRSAVSEQIISYNDQLIDEYNQTIEKNKKKQGDLSLEIKSLNQRQAELKTELSKLGNKLNEITDVSVSVKDEIAYQKKMITYYQDTLGCTDTQDINTCGNIPYSGSFIRPLSSGVITSPYGYRYHPTTGSYTFHNGIDIAGGATKIYAAAPGTVAGILWKTSCGGTMLFVHHNVNGVYYTTGYYHLKEVYVSIGDYVDQNTNIALMGGDASTWGWDSCSTGAHLHFAVSTGLYFKEYSYWSTFIANNIDPTSVVNFPAPGVWFSNRTTKY